MSTFHWKDSLPVVELLCAECWKGSLAFHCSLRFHSARQVRQLVSVGRLRGADASKAIFATAALVHMGALPGRVLQVPCTPVTAPTATKPQKNDDGLLPE